MLREELKQKAEAIIAEVDENKDVLFDLKDDSEDDMNIAKKEHAEWDITEIYLKYVL